MSIDTSLITVCLLFLAAHLVIDPDKRPHALLYMALFAATAILLASKVWGLFGLRLVALLMNGYPAQTAITLAHVIVGILSISASVLVATAFCLLSGAVRVILKAVKRNRRN